MIPVLYNINFDLKKDICQWVYGKITSHEVELQNSKMYCYPSEVEVIDYAHDNWENLLFPPNVPDIRAMRNELESNPVLKCIHAHNQLDLLKHPACLRINKTQQSVILQTLNTILSSCGITQQIKSESFIGMKRHAFQELKKTYRMDKVAQILSTLFDYDDFRDKFGVRIVEASGVTACPYCDRAFINQYDCNHEKTTAELDHFFPKSIYPFWAVSPWNLIPVCHTCNALMKKDRNPVVEPLLYPYQTKGSEIHFSQKLSKNGYMFDNPTHFDIIIDTDTEEAKNSVSAFHLNELYQSHRGYVANLAHLKRIQTHLMCDENARLLGINVHEVLSILDTVFESMKHQRILSKLTNDILDTLDTMMA